MADLPAVRGSNGHGTIGTGPGVRPKGSVVFRPERIEKARIMVWTTMLRSGNCSRRSWSPWDGPCAPSSRGRKPSGPFDLLLTDVVLPGKTGVALSEELVGERPGLRVLFMSGYTDQAVMQQGIIGKGAAFIQKPFTPVSLSRKVREVLDRPRV